MSEVPAKAPKARLELAARPSQMDRRGSLRPRLWPKARCLQRRRCGRLAGACKGLAREVLDASSWDLALENGICRSKNGTHDDAFVEKTKT